MNRHLPSALIVLLLATTPAAQASRANKFSPYVAVTFDPPFPQIDRGAPLMTPITNVVINCTNGQPFTGSIAFGAPYYNAGGCYGLVGTEIVLTCQLPPGPDGQKLWGTVVLYGGCSTGPRNL